MLSTESVLHCLAELRPELWSFHRMECTKPFLILWQTCLEAPGSPGHDVVPSLAQFKECLDNALRYRVWILGDPMWNQELDSVILVGSFWHGIFCNSVISCLFIFFYSREMLCTSLETQLGDVVIGSLRADRCVLGPGLPAHGRAMHLEFCMLASRETSFLSCMKLAVKGFSV